MRFTFLQPLLWLLLLPLLLWGLRVSLVDRPRPLKIASFALRVLAIVLLVLALCRPAWRQESSDVHVVFLVDVSESVDLAAARQAVDEVQTGIDQLKSGDSWSLFAVADGVRSFDQPAALAAVLDQWKKGIADDTFRAASRLGDSLLDTRLSFPAGKGRRVVLFTDGRDTPGTVTAAMETLQRESVDVLWKPLPGLAVPEAAIVAVEPSRPNAFEGEIVRLRVRMASNTAQKATLRILHDGVSLIDRPVTLAPGGETVEEIPVPMLASGASLWTAELQPAQDHFPRNNQASATVDVRGRPRILAIHDKPRDMRGFSRAMKEQQFDVDIRASTGLPDTLDALLAFDGIILADVPATSISPRQMDLLQHYVKDFGGGLAMFGSENSFGLGGYYRTPVEDVLPLISRYEKEKEKPSLALVLVMDKSGSMEGVPIALARQAAKASVELLGPQDQISVIGFDSQAQMICELRRASEKDAIQAAIDTMDAGGGTDVYAGMVAGKQVLDNASAKIKHMIVMTDGQTPQADFAGLTQGLADSGVTVSTVALGDGAAPDLLQAIAETGKGRFYQAADPASVPQIFTRETMQASKSAIKEDLYAPVIVGDHPMLAGFAKAELPSVLGFVMTEPKPATQVLLAADTGDPLLAVARFGLGQGLCWTSDLTEKWGGEFLAWDGCGKFWAQVLRGIVRRSDSAGLEARSTVTGTQWLIDLQRTDPSGAPVSGLTWDAETLDANGKRTPVTITPTGLGRYTATVPVAGQDRLTLRVRDTIHDKSEVLHYTAPCPAEYRLTSTVPPALSSLPPWSPATLRENLHPVFTRKSLSPLLSLLALTAALAGLVLRRI